MRSIKEFWRDQSGAAAAEYALILAIIGAGIVVAATLLGTNIAATITTLAGDIGIPA
jgi:pilus assembly protein Flp/PilA